MLNKLKEKIRWSVAFWLNKRKDTCWADLAMWAMNISGDYELRDYIPRKIGGSKWYTGVRQCRQDARQCGSCYCGKFVSETVGFHHPKAFIVKNEIEEDDAPDLTYIEFK